MTSFLSEERRTELVQEIQKLGCSPEDIDQFTNISDDLDEVDIILTKHVMTIALCQRNGELRAANVGLICFEAIMEEVWARGLGENDFPMSLSAIQHELAEH